MRFSSILQLPVPPAPTAQLAQYAIGGSSSTAPTGAYTMPTASTLGCPDVVSGTLDVDSHDAHVLFDSGATFSFISLDFVRRANISSQQISESIHVSSPGGLISSSVVCPGCTVSIGRDDFVANLMVIPLPFFDVILGMDWLHRY